MKKRKNKKLFVYSISTISQLEIFVAFCGQSIVFTKFIYLIITDILFEF